MAINRTQADVNPLRSCFPNDTAEMLLHTLAPSLNFATAAEPDPANAPTRRLTILLGAGASIFAGAPSTARLTEIVGERPISGAILRALRSHDVTRDANYEDAFHVLEQLEALKAPAPDRASASLRPFLQPFDQIGGIVMDREVVRRERFEVMETIAGVFSDVAYDRSWRTLADIFAVLLAEFNLDVFTLNYDLLADVAAEGISRITGKKWYNGFGSRIRGVDASFDPAEYASWNPAWGPKYLTLQHLHGSLRYVYASGQRFAHARRFVLEEGEEVDEIRDNWAHTTNLALEYPAETFCGIAPIISGLHKLEKLNVQPYANYFAAFAWAVSKSGNLLIIGYGKGDEHINYWIQEFAQIHNQTARVVEITDSGSPETFAMQRITEWPDLPWSQYRGLSDVFQSAAGVENLTITCGLQADSAIPNRLRELVIPFFAGGLAGHGPAH
jgi:hypothetical protein